MKSLKKNDFSTDECQACIQLFLSLSYAPNREDFEAILSSSQILKDLDDAKHAHLMHRLNKLALSAWSNAFIPGDATLWGRSSTQLSESFNNLLNKVRKLPITALFLYVHHWTIDKFIERKAFAQSNIEKNGPTPSIWSFYDEKLVCASCQAC
jgi:hypothetical protein